MTALTAGITPAGEGIDGVVWNILGQTYKPVAHGESCFAFDTLFPDGTFVPPHIHASQDEFIRVLEGRFDLVLDGQPLTATAGDLIRMPAGYVERSDFKTIPGGFVHQSRDIHPFAVEAFELKAGKPLGKKEKADVDFGWKIIKYVKSNGIIIVKDLQLIGVGADQTDELGAGEEHQRGQHAEDQITQDDDAGRRRPARPGSH